MPRLHLGVGTVVVGLQDHSVEVGQEQGQHLALLVALRILVVPRDHSLQVVVQSLGVSGVVLALPDILD